MPLPLDLLRIKFGCNKEHKKYLFIKNKSYRDATNCFKVISNLYISKSYKHNFINFKVLHIIFYMFLKSFT